MSKELDRDSAPWADVHLKTQVRPLQARHIRKPTTPAKAAYAEKLRDPRWQRVRLRVLERAGWACEDCEAEDKSLQVHHSAYSGSNPWDTPGNLLMCLCEDCHKTRQRLERRCQKALASWFRVHDHQHLEHLAELMESPDGFAVIRLEGARP